MEELFLLIQKTYGIAGLILLSPFVGLAFMYRQNIRLQGDVVKAVRETVESEKRRVKDAQDISNKLIEVVSGQSSLNTETNIALERIGDALNEIQTKFMQGR